MHLASSPCRRLSALLLVALFTALLGACGHAATEQECKEIIDKIVELELRGQNTSDPATLEQRKIATREAKEKDLLPRCLNRKITNEAMACIRRAQSYDEINNHCLR